MEKSAGFFTAFFGSCSGTEIFFRLMHHTWRRVIWHSLLICLFCGIAAGLVTFNAVRSNAALLRSAFLTAFGNEVLLGKTTIVPKQAPDIPRAAVLPSGGTLIYTGTGKKELLPEKKLSAANYSVIWRPEDLTVVAFQGEKEGVRIRFADGKLTRLTHPVLQDLLRSGEVSRKEEHRADFSLLIENILPGIRIYFIAVSALWFLVMSWLYTGIFCLMYRIFHASRLRVLTIGSMWKCGIYAGFPPLAVATVWQVLDLPLLNYETVFMIGLLIYWMIVIGRIENNPNPKENPSNE